MMGATLQEETKRVIDVMRSQHSETAKGATCGRNSRCSATTWKQLTYYNKIRYVILYNSAQDSFTCGVYR